LATNAAIGNRDTPVDIEAGQAQSFILGLTPNSEISPTEISFSFICANDGPAQVFVGLNTLYRPNNSRRGYSGNLGKMRVKLTIL